MSYKVKDHYFNKAKEQNYKARSVFKLEEIDQRYRLLKPGLKVLDLGAAPGSWTQYCSKKVGEKGFIFGVDLAPIQLSLSNAKFVQADLREANFNEIVSEQNIKLFDIVLSDMAPKTTGIKITDQQRSYELCCLALEIAKNFLVKDGKFVCKFFHSDSFKEFKNTLDSFFHRVEILKPKGTRKESKEIFLIGLGFKPISK